MSTEGSGAGRSCWHVLPAEVPHLVDHLVAPDRTRPVVAVTTRAGKPLLDPDSLAKTLGEQALVVLLDTGETTYELADQLTDMLTVYGGAARVWWPGLTRDSDPYKHPIVWVKPEDPSLAERNVLELVGASPVAEIDLAPSAHETAEPVETERPEPPAAAVEVKQPPTQIEPVVPAGGLVIGDDVEGQVASVDACGATIDVDGTSARVHITHLARGRVHDTADIVRIGQRVRGRVGQIGKDGVPRLNLAAFQDDPWMVLADQLRAGDLVRGRVVHEVKGGWLIELLPSATGYLPYDRAPREDEPRVGDVLALRLISLDPNNQRATVSLIDAPASAEGAVPVRLFPGGPVFLAPDSDAAELAASEVARLRAEIARLGTELDEAHQQIESLQDERKELRQSLRAARAGGRASDRARTQRTDSRAEPTTPGEWRLRIKEAYGQRYIGADRERYPLGQFDFGPNFIPSVTGLQGVDERRIAEACAHVAANRAHEIAGLKVHPLRAGEGGAPQRERDDGGKAWRLALQVGTPSARRLHYWIIPSAHGRLIEFDSVGVHDDGLLR